MDEQDNRWVHRRVEAQGADTRSAAERVAATFIDHGADFEGTLRLAESFRIDGEFRGTIESASTIIVGETAGIEADLRGRDVVIAGAVVGNVTATRQLTLRATGRVHGDIETPSLEIARGAVHNGRTRMVRPEVAARTGRAAGRPRAATAPASLSPRSGS